MGITQSFTAASNFYAHLTYTGLPESTEVTIIWKSGDTQLRRSSQVLGGDGWSWSRVSTSRPGGFAPGTYSVAFMAGADVIAARTFTAK